MFQKTWAGPMLHSSLNYAGFWEWLRKKVDLLQDFTLKTVIIVI